MRKILQFLMGVPTTPETRMLATLLSIMTMLLFTPTIFGFTQSFLEPFLISQWGRDYYIPVNIAVWLLLFPTIFFGLKSSLTSSAGALAMYAMNLINPIM